MLEGYTEEDAKDQPLWGMFLDTRPQAVRIVGPTNCLVEDSVMSVRFETEPFRLRQQQAFVGALVERVKALCVSVVSLGVNIIWGQSWIRDVRIATQGE